MSPEQAFSAMVQLVSQATMTGAVHEQLKVALSVLKKAVEDADKYTKLASN